MGIFDKRVNFKPFEYPETMDFVDKMNKTFWVHSEVEFTSDVQNFHSNLTPTEKEVVKRSLLSIAQVEVSVKTFWGDLYKHLQNQNLMGSVLPLQNVSTVMQWLILNCSKCWAIMMSLPR